MEAAWNGQFPKADIDAIDEWPRPRRSRAKSGEGPWQAECKRLRDENGQLRAELESARTGRALAELRINHLEDDVARRTAIIRYLLDDEADLREGLQ